MKVDSIQLKHYRNYSDIQLNFSPNINIFIGQNAQGKTNLLESLYVLAMTRSHRTHNEKELIQMGESQAMVCGKIHRHGSEIPLEVMISNRGRRTKVNYLEQSRLSTYVGQLNVILFSPEDLSLVKGSPALRRKFIDMDLGQISPKYMHELSQYQHILKQRNQYLKKNATQIDELYLSVLDDQLVESGAQIMVMRAQFIQQLEKIAQQMHARVSLSQEILELNYLPNVSCETFNLADIQSAFREKLQQSRQRDCYQKTTSVGPHRDDLKFLINARDVQRFGSQGQQRLSVLSMKLAEIDLMKAETGEYPILLLDDVMSELDNERQMELMKVIEGKVQTFITTTTLEHLKNNMAVTPTVFQIHNDQVAAKEEG